MRMNPTRFDSGGKFRGNQRGRIRPLLIGMVILISGLLLDRSWWQVGMVILIILFVEGLFHYRKLN